MKRMALLLILCTSYSSAQSPLINSPRSRNPVTLNGQWRIIVDPYETGYYNYRYQPSTNGYFRDRKPENRWDLVEYDFDASEILQVPGDWNSQTETLFLYEGTVWYKKSFDYHLKSGRRLFVWFGAANYEAKVWLNGEKLGEHEGGFTPFNFEITDLVREKKNALIVKVDNKRRHDAVPTVNTDWWNFGGLTRDVMLVETGETFIRDWRIQMDRETGRHIAGWIQLDGSHLRKSVTVTLPEAGVKTRVEADENGHAEFTVKANVERWSPENPRLYDVILAVEGEEVTDRIGFRTIETRGCDLMLNGEPVFLRGVCIHEQAPMRGGRAFSREDARTLLGWAKELGCNFVRLAHYPHNEYMVRTADEMGLMVWAEVPVYWTIQWENPAVLANAKNQLAEVIARDRNRASVILWSMANETPLSDARLAFLRSMIGMTREMDPDRLITAACERRYLTPSTQIVDDPLGAYLDVMGVNEYMGWYDGQPGKCDTLSWTMSYDKPLIISEFGGGALQGHHGDALTRWTEEYQASVYEHQIGMLKRIPFLRGTAPWILADFRSPRRPLPGIQDLWNRKGLISDRGVKKRAFYIMRDFYKERRDQNK